MLDQATLNELCPAADGYAGLLELEQLQGQLNELRILFINDIVVRRSCSDEAAALESLAVEILRSRRRREALFGTQLFGEPAWDIMLELYAAEQSEQRISVSSVCIGSAVPATTALRWVERLEKDCWVLREPDPRDGRRWWVRLSEKGSETMKAFLEGLALRLAAQHRSPDLTQV